MSLRDPSVGTPERRKRLDAAGGDAGGDLLKEESKVKILGARQTGAKNEKVRGLDFHRNVYHMSLWNELAKTEEEDQVFKQEQVSGGNHHDEQKMRR
ncbi:Hypothetical protein SMAX5B_019792 [Scophthalmus maximus]|uniref:Uncharacterized protein n=1 Tax=Scophthalmus maximus TaxID=52904 RepID=A0A2U9BRS7_SCOMX|nr:Hypothetical protein SMAX5B_019792 [Scophthalmus maximus]